MKRIYLDTEYCYPGIVKGSPRPTSSDQRQIVQIAAIVFDTEASRELAYFDRLVVPTYQRELPDFFTELTGITQQQVDENGISFAQAFEEFVDFCDDTPIFTFDKDEEVLRQNCDYVSMQWPFTKPFTRVKALLPQWGVDPNGYSSGTLYKAAGLTMNGHVHNALHDIRSMSQAISVFENSKLTQP